MSIYSTQTLSNFSLIFHFFESSALLKMIRLPRCSIDERCKFHLSASATHGSSSSSSEKKRRKIMLRESESKSQESRVFHRLCCLCTKIAVDMYFFHGDIHDRKRDSVSVLNLVSQVFHHHPQSIFGVRRDQNELAPVRVSTKSEIFNSSSPQFFVSALLLR